MDKEFGQLLQTLRKKSGLKQQELGEEINMHGASISRFESGNIPDQETLSKIARVLFYKGVEQNDIDRLFSIAKYPLLSFPARTSKSDLWIDQIKNQFDHYSDDRASLYQNDLHTFLEFIDEFEKSRDLKNSKKFPEATTKLKSLDKRIKSEYLYWSMRVYETLGDCQYGELEFSGAIWSFENALACARDLQKQGEEGELLLKLGNVKRRHGGEDCRLAIISYQSAKRIFDQMNRKDWAAGCLRKIGGAELFLGLPNQGFKDISESISLSRSVNSDLNTYKGLQHLGWACSMLGRWNEAISYTKEALSLIPEKNLWDKIKGYRYLGDTLRIARKIDEALEAYRTALDLVDRLKIEKSHTVGLIYLGIAKIYIRREENDKARKMLSEGLAFHGGLGEDFRAMDFIIEQACLDMNSGQLPTAKKSFQMAELYYQSQNNSYYQMRVLALISQLNSLDADSKNDQFDQMLDKAKKIYRSSGDEQTSMNYFYGQILFYSGKALIEKYQFNDAFDTWSEAAKKLIEFNEISYQEFLKKVKEATFQYETRLIREKNEENKEAWKTFKVMLKQENLIQDVTLSLFFQ